MLAYPRGKPSCVKKVRKFMMKLLTGIGLLTVLSACTDELIVETLDAERIAIQDQQVPDLQIINSDVLSDRDTLPG